MLSEGDPLFYGSYMHLHVRLAGTLSDRGHSRRHRHVAAAGRAPAMPIDRGDDVLAVLPGTMAEAELAAGSRLPTPQ